jgi:uncharacterized protein YjbI with pentapeptide repeats
MLAQILRSRGVRIAAAIAIAATACGGLTAAAGPVRASTTSVCPTVSASGKVTPAPKPSVHWDRCSLDGANLAGANLTGANLSYAQLSDANLTGATLTNADLAVATLQDDNLTGAKLAGADLDETLANGVTGTPKSLPAHWHLVRGNLLGPTATLAEMSNLSGADLAGYDLENASLASSNLTGVNFLGADLDGADFSGDTLTGANLSGADLAGAALRYVRSGGVTGSATTVLPQHWTLLDGSLLGPYAELGGADLSGLNLAGVDLDSAFLSGADVSGAELAHTDLTMVSSGGLTGTPASLPAHWLADDGYLMGPGADLLGAPLGNLDLAGADLAGAFLSDATLSRADLAGTDLNRATLTSAAMTGADLNSADLDGAGLRYANLAGATLTGATVAGATWLHTVCPNGASSDKHVAGCLSPLDTTRPTVSVTGVSRGRAYVLGDVPAAHCRTTDNGRVATPAKVRVTTTGAHGAGRFTATCAGAVDLAGNRQAAPVSVSYTVIYGMAGFLAPARGATIARSSRVITVRFRLSNAGRTPVTAAVASALAASHHVRAVLRGPGIAAVTANCPWNASRRYLTCAVKIPGGVRTGAAFGYTVTAYENLGDGLGFVRVPGVGGTSDPETVHFR